MDATPLRPLLAEAIARLATAEVASPRADAEWLLAHCLDVPRSRLPLTDAVPAAAAARFAELVTRREAREPLQYLLGTAAFRHVELAVGPGVFVPRPETELLVDAVLPSLRLCAAPAVVDLCSGSGALAVAVAHEVPAARVFAVERSAQALPWLRRNTAGTAVEVVAGDIDDPALLDGPLAGVRGSVDAVLCNPPYVPAGTAVGAEVAADPAEAVFAGADGLALIPAVLALAAALLRPGGMVVIEHDDTHAQAVPDLLAADGRWADVVDHTDLAGRPRYVTATRARTA